MLQLTIDTDNAAFEGDDLGVELARILRDLACRLEDSSRPALVDSGELILRDINGNRVGEAAFSADA